MRNRRMGKEKGRRKWVRGESVTRKNSKGLIKRFLISIKKEEVRKEEDPRTQIPTFDGGSIPTALKRIP